MGILQRVVSMTKAAANEMLDKMENPVMMLNQYLRDLDEEIDAAERALAGQQAQERILENKLKEQQSQAGYYETKAEQAAAQERETEARAALEAKLLYLEQAEETLRLQQLAREAVAELGQRVETLKEERERLQSKRSELVARARKAGVAGGFGGSAEQSLHGSSALKGFERIEQKVMEWEAQRELAQGSTHRAAAAAAVPDREEQEAQRNRRIDEELNRLLNRKPGCEP